MPYDELCSPMLVKEVRQALRGRSFALGFTGALGLAGLVAGISLLELGGGVGELVVLPIFFVLAAALLVFVPFHAHQSMRQEDAEGARDLLALSPMGPWRIVLGKLAAALVLAALTLAAFVPFVVVIALQPAVDPVTTLVQLAHLSGVTAVLAALGVATGAMRANRLGRGLGVVVLAFATLGMLALEVQFAQRAFRGSTHLDVPAFTVFVLGSLGLGAFAPLLLGFAAAALARDDRDISRGLRIAWLVVVCVMVLMVSVSMPLNGASVDAIVMCAVVTILAGSFVAAVVVTEDEGLDGESRRRLGRIRWRPLRGLHGLLAVGGGRGVALTLALGLLISVAALIGIVQGSSGTGRSYPGGSLSPFVTRTTFGVLARSAFLLATTIGVSLAFAALPAHILGRSPNVPAPRRFARWSSAISLLTLSAFLPVLLVVVSSGSFDEDALFFSPLYVLIEAADDVDRTRAFDAAVFLWGCIGVVAFCVAVPSLARGIREVLQSSPSDDGASAEGDGNG